MGIGTTSPVAKLDVVGDNVNNSFRVSSSPGIYRFRVDQNYDMYMSNGSLIDTIAIKNNGSAYFSGDVGIGTVTPQGKLDIQSGYNRKIFKTVALSQTDYHPFYFKLFPIPAVTDVNSTIISGKLSAERVNDIGVSAEIDFHVSRSYHGAMYASYEVTKGDISPDLRILNIGGVDWLVFRFLSAPTWLSMTFDGTFYSTEFSLDSTYLTAVELASDTSTVASGINYQHLKLNPQGGNVGIGASTPAASLEVKRTIADANFAGWIEGTQASNLGLGVNIAQTSSAGVVADFKAGGTSRMYVRGDGNVGIGTTSPGYGLDINRNLNQVAGFQSPNPNTWIDINSTAGSWSIGSAANSSFQIYER